jgi:hypothetical protein
MIAARRLLDQSAKPQQQWRTAMKAKTRSYVIAAIAMFCLTATANAQPQWPPQSPNMSFFVTSAGSGKGADLGGIVGADEHCQRLGTAAGAGDKTWRAYLSTNEAGGSINARDRIGRGPWQNFDGEIGRKTSTIFTVITTSSTRTTR